MRLAYLLRSWQGSPSWSSRSQRNGTSLGVGWNFDSWNEKLWKLFLFCRASGAVSRGQS
jgi:hypothetical protein